MDEINGQMYIWVVSEHGIWFKTKLGPFVANQLYFVGKSGENYSEFG